MADELGTAREEIMGSKSITFLKACRAHKFYVIYLRIRNALAVVHL